MQQTMLDRVDRVADDVVSLVLRATTGPLAPWEPGAHLDLALPNRLTRQYSLCGDPADRESYRIAVRHEPLSRGGSEYVHLFLRPARTLEVSLPRNHFPLVPAPEYLFLAGGIGITPILPMFRSAVEAGIPATLVYAGKSAATMPFATDLRAAYGDRVHLFTTRDQRRPDFAALSTGLNPRALIYCCGPAPMLAAAETAFPAERIHTERFRPATRTFAPNTPFEATCARSGRTIQVAPNESLLDALHHAGHAIPSGCREGICGSCELTVLAGTPDHRDDIGAPNDRIYACVSRARSPRLILDL
ncbi:PDR/VanB family oxidoreductase [Embleya scabrispora]|uniref:PDR/VanB family oxidoreductase n=1 Tax=Embleya scabrispora TaxID=159449 RepID=UPI00037B1BAD|nr:PDR/VanB family oxidoreductase [Embleya scabrispora]MYS85214.1 2Fe-2S iron-sulfur cluster binding domain-containing protein [Streptomyces sp. SID5474]